MLGLRVIVTILCLATVPAASETSLGATVPDGFVDELVLGSLPGPMSIRFLPDGRMLVTRRAPALVRVIAADGSAVINTALTIPDVPSDGERGLLSIAVDPQWPARPYLYAYYTANAAGNAIVLTRYTGSGDLDGTGDGTLSFDSPMTLIPAIDDVCSNHNGGDLRFAPDGMLLLSIGDDENKCAAQVISDPLGNVLRMKVSDLPPTGNVGLSDLVPSDNPFVESPGEFEKLTWAYGLRNPFRMHVDPLTGSAFVADVGWTQREEISHVEVGGTNLGWPYHEGDLSIATSITQCSCWSCDCDIPTPFNAQRPIEDYGRGSGRSVISGGVYRAPRGASYAWPAEYEGDYFYSDYFNGYLRRLKGSGQSWSLADPVAGQADAEFWATGLGGGVVSFELGPDGSLYYVNLTDGELRRIRYTVETATERSSFGALKGRYRSPD